MFMLLTSSLRQGFCKWMGPSHQQLMYKIPIHIHVENKRIPGKLGIVLILKVDIYMCICIMISYRLYVIRGNLKNCEFKKGE